MIVFLLYLLATVTLVTDIMPRIGDYAVRFVFKFFVSVSAAFLLGWLVGFRRGRTI